MPQGLKAIDLILIWMSKMMMYFLVRQYFSNLQREWRTKSSNLLDSPLLWPLKQDHIQSLSFQCQTKTIFILPQNLKD